MISRFAVVPALPVKTDDIKSVSRFYTAATVRFDIYDNQEKERLKRGFASRSVAADACRVLNATSRSLMAQHITT